MYRDKIPVSRFMFPDRASRLPPPPLFNTYNTMLLVLPSSYSTDPVEYHVLQLMFLTRYFESCCVPNF